MSVKENLIENFKDNEQFTLKDAYKANPDTPTDSVRARIYENLGIVFEKVKRGIFKVVHENETCILIEGDGRDLSFLEDESIDCIITDHPWEDKAANKGGSRNFAKYDCFRYEQKDFDEKARVLKNGCFMVEFIPTEKATNYEYLYELKQMAKNAGFEYYAKIPWKKGTFVSNTGRTAKNMEDVMIFTKGKARELRPDRMKDKADPSVKHLMSGAAGMLPAIFDHQPPSKKERIHQAEKPVSLIEEILKFITLEYEIVLDQFAGSGVVGEACINMDRKAILIEKDSDNCENINNRLMKAEMRKAI